MHQTGGPRLPTHSDLKMSAAAVDDESSHDNEKHNCGGDRPPVIFAPPWVRPPAVVAATRTTSIFKVYGLSFSFPALVTDKAKRVEHLEQCILVVVTGNFLHELRDAAPQGGIINSHERSDQP
jgi:hypothetical protein